MSEHSQKYIIEFSTTSDITKEEFEVLISRLVIDIELKTNELWNINCHVYDHTDASNILVGKVYRQGYKNGLDDGRAELDELRDQLSRLQYPDTTGQ